MGEQAIEKQMIANEARIQSGDVEAWLLPCRIDNCPQL
jgi:hypothetical protein